MKNFNTNKNSNQSGRSMIEMLGVLAIVGVLSVGGIAGYSKAMMKFKINKTIDQVTHIATNIRTLYSQQTTYAGLNAVNAIEMGAIPDGLGSIANWVGYADYISGNPFGGGVNVYGGSSDRGFNIAYTGLSKEACITLATYDWGSNHSSGLLAITVHSIFSLSGPRGVYPSSTNDCHIGEFDYAAAACPGDSVNPTPMSVTKAAQACNCGDEGCSVGWTFK